MSEKFPLVHLVNPMQNAYGGSEARTFAMAKILNKRGKAKIWSEYPFDSTLNLVGEINKIQPRYFRFPIGGILVFVGTYFSIGNWLRYSYFEKIIVINNIPGDFHLKNFFRQIHAKKPKASVVICHASPEMKRKSNLPGAVLLSPIDFDSFFQVAKSREANKKSLVVGRLSRDEPDKHHPDDIRVYKALNDRGFRIRIMGGECISKELVGLENVEILPCGKESAKDFLQSLDVFFYRTHPSWFEPHGRVISEAMAAGLPVVAGRNGGYANHLIEDGVNGFLIDSNDIAISVIKGLSENSAYRSLISNRAKNSIESLSKNVDSDLIDFIYKFNDGVLLKDVV